MESPEEDLLSIFFCVRSSQERDRERGLKYENLGAAIIEHSFFNISQPLTQVFQNSVMVEHNKPEINFQSLDHEK